MTKTKIAILAVVALVSGFLVTHTDTFCTRVYEKKMITECNIDIICRLGASLVEAPVVACMEDQVFPWTDNTVAECLSKVTNEVKGE